MSGDNEDDFLNLYHDLVKSITLGNVLERSVFHRTSCKTSSRASNCSRRGQATSLKRERDVDIQEHVRRVVETCREARRCADSNVAAERESNRSLISTDAIVSLTRHTDRLSLASYAPFLDLVPRQVNVVTLAEAIPVCDTTTRLPLDLRRIATRCNGVFFAPRRFAAVQLAFTNPRCRILVFHTGRVVGTGSTSAVAARLALARAQRQLAEEAGVFLHIRKFQVINIVGAVSLNATLDCDAFANAHQTTSHFDSSSFVGLAWRPQSEACCCEIYSTGRANLPGARTQHALLASFFKMLPELFRFSSTPEKLVHFSKEDRERHRPVASMKTTMTTATTVIDTTPTLQFQNISEALRAANDADGGDEAAQRLVESLGL